MSQLWSHVYVYTKIYLYRAHFGSSSACSVSFVFSTYSQSVTMACVQDAMNAVRPPVEKVLNAYTSDGMVHKAMDGFISALQLYAALVWKQCCHPSMVGVYHGNRIGMGFTVAQAINKQ